MRTLTFVSGASIGAGLMYLMDPDRGERRRAGLRDTLSELGESELVERAMERARNLELPAAVRGMDMNAVLERSSGMLERPSNWWSSVSGAAQPTIKRWGKSARPAIERSREALDRGRDWAGIRPRRRSRFSTGDWALLGGLLGAAVVGIWLGRRALANRDGSEVVRTVTIEAPVERVYQFWNDFENFPRFMSHVREVRRMGNDRTHWVVAGPGGAPVEWDAVVTQRAPNDSISWRTVEGALIDHSGTVRFRPAGPNATRVEVRMTYRPTGGALGQGVATLFGTDPERVIDEDLARVATQLRGQRPAVGDTGARH
jgi:uncharacterized membrane protein